MNEFSKKVMRRFTGHGTVQHKWAIFRIPPRIIPWLVSFNQKPVAGTNVSNECAHSGTRQYPVFLITSPSCEWTIDP